MQLIVEAPAAIHFLMMKRPSTVQRGGLCSVILTIAQSVFLLSFFLLLLTRLCQCQHGHIQPLLQKLRWSDDQKALSRTYYERHCTRDDISATTPADFTLSQEWDTREATENLLAHGVSIFPGLVDKNSADRFRNYTLVRNARLEKDEMVYVMNSFNKQKQTRWSFAFSPGDDPSIPGFLQQIGRNEKLRQLLEGFLGQDPAIIKMQTMTAGYGAESQGWHPDVNAKSSSLSHARDFLMHFSLFVALQDTPPRMGATGICPGTHYCASVDEDAYENGCLQVTTGTDSDGRAVWLAGDAVLMNQNTWHRGCAHTLRGGEDRAMAVITFTSRPRRSYSTNGPTHTPLPPISNVNNQVEGERGDVETRSMSLGTPLSSFGYTFADIVDPSVSMPQSMAFLTHLGLYKASQGNWGWDFVTSLFGRIAFETHQFKRQDLHEWLQRHKKGNFGTRFLLKRLLWDGIPKSDQNRAVWDLWISASLEKSASFFRRLMFHSVLFGTALWCFGAPVSERRKIKGLVLWCLVILVVIGGFHWKIWSSQLIRDIRSGAKLRSSFPIANGRYVEFTEPARQDVLIGTRFNSLYLGAMNSFLDYHTGNRLWRDHIRDFLDAFDMQAIRPSVNVQNPLLDRLAAQVKGAVHGRFLLQLPETGRFVELDDKQALQMTKRRFLTDLCPLLHILDESISFMVSQLRFESTLRQTSLARFSVSALEHIRDSMFGERCTRRKRNGLYSHSKQSLQLKGHFMLRDKLVVGPTVSKLPSSKTVPCCAELRQRSSQSASGNASKGKLSGKRVVQQLKKSRQRRKAKA